MSGNLVKRQHFVPRTYLKHFSESQGGEYYINALAKEKTKKEDIFRPNITSIALEKHLYTMPGKTIEQKMAIEKFYAEELEAHYDSIYGLLTDDTKESITQEERELIISTVVTMFYRTTIWINSSRDLMYRLFKQAYALCEQNGTDSFTLEGEKISIKGRELNEHVKEFNKARQPGMILTQLEVAMKLIKLRLANDTICIVKIEGEGQELFTCDNPVIARHVNPQSSGKRYAPFDPENKLTLPLDSKHVLILMPGCIKQHEHKIIRRTSLTPRIEKTVFNYLQMENSEKFLFGSKSALESYLDKKQETENPLSEEEQAMSLKDLIKKKNI